MLANKKQHCSSKKQHYYIYIYMCIYSDRSSQHGPLLQISKRRVDIYRARLCQVLELPASKGLRKTASMSTQLSCLLMQLI